ncbi:serine protease snake-like isoform X2 [Cimex lectularius]|uniref:Peptidase S1 domain-containing protein n=1 Tax=Cimex lectularius TaxID=79782 RepID=A0A8I6S5P0_CIMLE|nr:serine protease snake-like isoform X2 [Cimex lectularius]
MKIMTSINRDPLKQIHRLCLFSGIAIFPSSLPCSCSPPSTSMKKDSDKPATHCPEPSLLCVVVSARTDVMLLVEAVAFTVFFTAAHSQRLEGELCEDNGQSSFCKKLIECPTAQSAIRHGKRPEICGFDGILPIVCCPPSAEMDTTTLREQWGITSTESWNSFQPPTTRRNSNRRTSKSKQMCQKYAEYVYRIVESPSLLDSGVEKVNECALIEETLIVGGTFASLNEFPHMVHIGYGEEPRISYLCGGSLISERFVLSAAHCTKPRGLAKWARFGNLNLQNSRTFKQIILRIIRHYNHPEYDSVRLYNDIALFKLEKDVPLSPEIRPVCLQTDFSFSSTSAIATGWGHVSWGGFSSDRLKKVTLNIVDSATCNNSFRSSIGGSQLPYGILDKTMICAGDERGKDACQGDSGGPLQITLKKPYCMYSIIGITSFGKNCGQSIPGVYTRVSHFIPWIESIVWP